MDSSGNDDYCCYAVGVGDDSTCTPDDDLTPPCTGTGLYGYQCADGDDPTSFDSSLVCSTATPDPDGVHDDYCCTDEGSSSSSGGGSGGGPPAGCTADSTLDCSGGADGYSCAAGDNPGDATLACSTPVAQPDGTDGYCCFAWTLGPIDCTPDDELTSLCPDADSYGFQCQSGGGPAWLDASLICSAGVSDPDGVHQDYCCTYQ
jgi:hypothetical protein